MANKTAAKAESFSCSDGRRLRPDEEANYLAYLDAGITPPDAYNDVVFDNSGGRTHAGYRCKTAAEKEAEAERARLAEEGRARVARRDAVLKEAGVDPATGVALGVDTGLDPNLDLDPDAKRGENKGN